MLVHVELGTATFPAVSVLDDCPCNPGNLLWLLVDGIIKFFNLQFLKEAFILPLPRLGGFLL